MPESTIYDKYSELMSKLRLYIDEEATVNRLVDKLLQKSLTIEQLEKKPGLRDFLEQINKDKTLKDIIKTITEPNKLISIAQKQGSIYNFNRQDLTEIFPLLKEVFDKEKCIFTEISKWQDLPNDYVRRKIVPFYVMKYFDNRFFTNLK